MHLIAKFQFGHTYPISDCGFLGLDRRVKTKSFSYFGKISSICDIRSPINFFVIRGLTYQITNWVYYPQIGILNGQLGIFFYSFWDW